MALEIEGIDFEKEVLENDKPVLVDFFATWCPPCKMIAPFIKELAQEMQDTVKIVKLDTDNAQDIAQRYEIKSIPTLIMFNGGNIVNKKIGGASKDDIKAFIESNI